MDYSNNIEYEKIEYKDVIIGYAFIDRVHTHNFEHKKAYEILAKMLYIEYNIDIETLVLIQEQGKKPYFRDNPVYFNISHTKGLVVCAVSRKTQVGVDAEAVRKHPARVVDRVMNEAEKLLLDKALDKDKIFFELWTYKESVIKLTGVGIGCDLKKVSYVDMKYDFGQWSVIKDGVVYAIALSSY